MDTPRCPYCSGSLKPTCEGLLECENCRRRYDPAYVQTLVPDSRQVELDYEK